MNSDSRAEKVLATTAWAAVWIVATQALAGLWLGLRYRASWAETHASVTAIRDAREGAFFASFHYWGGSALVALASAHVGLMLVARRTSRQDRLRWWGALCVLGCALIVQVTGNLLPMDAHAVETVVVEAHVAALVPLIGVQLSEGMLGGATFGEATLSLWYGIHRLAAPVGLLLGSLAGVGFLGRIPGARPHRLVSGLLAFCPAVLALLWVAPLGEPAAAANATGVQGALPGWYAWPLHGLVRMFGSLDPSLGWVGLLLPLAVGAYLAALPFLGRHAEGRVPLVLTTILLAGGMGCALWIGGAPASLVTDTMGEAAPAARVDAPIDAALSVQGRALFQKVGCAKCHTVDRSTGRGGPNLDRVHERVNDPTWYQKLIRKPSAVRAGATMPSFDLPEADLRALAEYLRDPDRSER